MTLSPIHKQHFVESKGLSFAVKSAAQFENTDYVYQLICNTDSSAFTYEGRAASTDLSLPYMYGVHSEYFCDHNTVRETQFNDNYEHYRSYPVMTRDTWTIHTDTTGEILGYKVVRAALAEKPHLRVWFAPSLPLSSGPHGLGGLPGLILAVEDSKLFKTTKATSIRILPKEISIIPWPQFGQRLDRDDYKLYLKRNYGRLRS